MMETTIYNFHTSLYIPEIHKLAFHIPNIQILGMNHCGDSRRTVFNAANHFKMCYFSVITHLDYAERVVASFSYQMQSKYCGGNISVSIEGITLEHFSALPKK